MFRPERPSLFNNASAISLAAGRVGRLILTMAPSENTEKALESLQAMPVACDSCLLGSIWLYIFHKWATDSLSPNIEEDHTYAMERIIQMAHEEISYKSIRHG